MTAIVRTMHGIKIGQREVDGYVNATALCKAHFEATGQRRDVSEWASNQRTQESIEHLSLKTGIPVIKLVESKSGRYGGTWIHPKLAIRFAIWLSDDFGYQVEEWVSDWIAQGALRQQHDNARIEGKATRRQLTDAIRDYLTRHPEVSDNHRKWMYSNASEAVNLVVFGKKAKKLCEELGVAKEDLRDCFDGDNLQIIREVENTAMRLIDKKDVDPLEAIKQCGDRLAIA